MINSEQESRVMIEEIEDRAEGLSDWEEQFVDSLGRVDKLSVKQREIIDRIHEQRVTGPWKMNHHR